MTELKNVVLSKPLAVLDLETTGIHVPSARIVEFGAVRFTPDGSWDGVRYRFNPGVPIPPEATKKHGITDAMVATAPPFARSAKQIVTFLDGCDLCGFNIKRFDLPILENEMERARVAFTTAGRAVVDVLDIYRDREKRDLTAALRFYCGRDHAAAHSALGDAHATAAVLDAMLERYTDLPHSFTDLAEVTFSHEGLDPDGWFILVDGVVCIGRSNYRGTPVADVVQENRGLLEWIISKDFSNKTKRLAQEFLACPQPW